MAPSLIAPMSLVSVAARRPRTVAAGSSLTGLAAVVASLGDDEWYDFSATGYSSTWAARTKANFDAFTVVGGGTTAFANDAAVAAPEGSDGVETNAGPHDFCKQTIFADGAVVCLGHSSHGSGADCRIAKFDPLTAAWTVGQPSATYRPRTDTKPTGQTQGTNDVDDPVGWPDLNTNGVMLPGAYHRYGLAIAIDADRLVWGGSFGGKHTTNWIGAPWVYDKSDDSVGIFQAAGVNYNSRGWADNVESVAYDPVGDRILYYGRASTQDYRLWTRRNVTTAMSASQVALASNGGAAWSAQGLYAPALFLDDPGNSGKGLFFFWIKDSDATAEYMYWKNIGPSGSEGSPSYAQTTFTTDPTAILPDYTTKYDPVNNNANYRRGICNRTGSSFLISCGDEQLFLATMAADYTITIAAFGGTPTGATPAHGTTSSGGGANYIALRRLDLGAELPDSQRYAIMMACEGDVFIRPDREAA